MKRWLNVLLVLCVLAAGASMWVARGRPLPNLLRRPAPEPAVVPLPTLDHPARLAILNGTRVDGLANTFSLAMPVIGCVGERVGNAPHRKFARTLLINRKLDDATADAIAQRLGGLPVLKEMDARTTEDAVLVVGADYETVLQRLESR
jgi:hypothetical protein